MYSFANFFGPYIFEKRGKKPVKKEKIQEWEAIRTVCLVQLQAN
jgi:hypothetical protein